MNPETFERAAAAVMERIPAPYREGVDALEVSEETVSHPEIPEVFTLGECVSEAWGSGYGEGDLRSRLILYHGSFRELARRDPEFDWEAELRETVLHELLHHREWAAGEDGLDLVDRAVEHNQRRHAGLDFDPDFYRALPPGPDGAVRVESETFVEGRLEEPAEEVEGDGGGSSAAPGEGAGGSAAPRARFQWRDREYRLPVPSGEWSHLYVRVRNLAGGRLWVVLRRPGPAWKRWLGLESPRARHSEARARGA